MMLVGALVETMFDPLGGFLCNKMHRIGHRALKRGTPKFVRPGVKMSAPMCT